MKGQLVYVLPNGGLVPLGAPEAPPATLTERDNASTATDFWTSFQHSTSPMLQEFMRELDAAFSSADARVDPTSPVFNVLGSNVLNKNDHHQHQQQQKYEKDF
jgi:hypothetical protein